MTKKITDLEGRLDAAFKRADQCGCKPKKFEYDEIIGFSTSQIMCKFHANEYKKQLNSHEN